MIGQVVSRYQILETLGHGGMGVVYKARDTRLERYVALKFLSGAISQNEPARQRFIKEARAASALDHPNICTIYGIEDTDDGRTFIAMPCYEGEDLAKRLERGRLGLQQAVAIAIQVGQGLDKAHAQGIVHRDVKPGNVMLTRDGGVKLLDFGLALLGESVRNTQPGSLTGTPGYMSPEQASGSLCDARTDLWSLGVMLYEMLTGQLPFRGTHPQALIHAILRDDPVLPVADQYGFSLALDDILARALEKDPERRYQTAREFAASLRAEIPLDGPPPDISSAETTSLTLATQGVPSVGRSGISILVLPFQNLSSDEENEYFADGLTEELITYLGKVGQLRVLSRNFAFQFKGQSIDVRKVGRELRVDNVLEGSVRKVGERLRVTVQLVNVSDGYQIWSERFDRQLEDVFLIQDEVVANIVTALRARLTEPVTQAIAPPRRPQNMEAYNLYLKGRYHFVRQTPEGLSKAVELFEKATALDPGYAPPFAGLAEYYFAIGFWGGLPPDEIWPKAHENALRAVELDPNLAHAQVALGYVRIFCDWDWIKAGRNFRRAVELSPGDPNVAYANAVYLLQTARLDEALAEFRHAAELDPLALNLNTALAMVYYYRREYEKAIAQAMKTLELDPEYFEMRAGLGLIYLQTNRFDEGLRYLEGVRAQSGDNPLILGMLGYAYGVAGADDKARQILSRLEVMSKERYVAPISQALPHIGLGEHDASFEWLEKAAEAHDALLCYLDVMPCYDPLRHDSRFPALRRRIGLIAQQPTVF